MAVPGYAQSEKKQPGAPGQAGAKGQQAQRQQAQRQQGQRPQGQRQQAQRQQGQRQQGQRQQGQRQQGQAGARGPQGGPGGPNEVPRSVKVAGALSKALKENDGNRGRAADALQSLAQRVPDQEGKAALLKAATDIRKGGQSAVDAIFAAADKAGQQGGRPAAGGRQQGGRQQGGRPAAGGRQQGGRPAAGGRQQGGRPSAGGRQQGGRQQGGRPAADRTPPRVFVALRGVFGDEPDRDKGLAPSAILQGLMKLDENKDGKLSPNELMQPSKP